MMLNKPGQIQRETDAANQTQSETKRRGKGDLASHKSFTFMSLPISLITA